MLLLTRRCVTIIGVVIMNWVSSFDTKFDAVIAHTDAVEITPDVVAQMMMKGFTEAELLKFKAEGFRYSPTRNSVSKRPSHGILKNLRRCRSLVST